MLTYATTMCHMGTQPTPDMHVIGRRVAKRREALGLDQEQLADKATLSRPYISRLERGLVPSPKLLDLAAVADALDLTLDALIYGDPPKGDEEVAAILARMPGASVAMTNLARGLQWAKEDDRDFVLGTLEQLAQRFGRPDPSQ